MLDAKLIRSEPERVRQAMVNRGADVALLDELHYRRPDKELTYRAHSKKRLIGDNSLAFVDIRISVALAEYDPAIFDHGHSSAGDVISYDLGRHDSI